MESCLSICIFFYRIFLKNKVYSLIAIAAGEFIYLYYPQINEVKRKVNKKNENENDEIDEKKEEDDEINKNKRKRKESVELPSSDSIKENDTEELSDKIDVSRILDLKKSIINNPLPSGKKRKGFIFFDLLMIY
jgi:predicted membrane protein